MKGVASDVTALQSSISVSPSIRIIADVNQNRHNNFDQAYVDANENLYYGAVVSSAGGIGGEYYKDAFPISSVVNPMRPQSTGVAWGRDIKDNGDGQRPYNVFHSAVKYNSLSTGGTAPIAQYNSSADYYSLNPRLYYRGPGIAYQNYTTNSIRDGWFRWTAFDTSIKYETSFWTNKLSIGFETTLGDPSAESGLTISLTTDGTSWTTIKSSGSTVLNPSVDSDGRVTLYRNSDGTWTTTVPAYSNAFWDSSSGTIPNAIRIKGIKITCQYPHGPVTLIEVKPSLTTDITHRVSEWSWDANIAEQDSLHPVGTVSSNKGSITLINDDGNLSEQNRSDTYCYISELSREFCEFSGYMNVSQLTTANIPQFKAFGNIWSDSSDNTYSVEITDIIGVLQEMQAPQLILKDVTPTQAIWRALDMAGVGPVKIRKNSSETENIIHSVWCDKDQSLWDFVKSICADTRYSVYADESGVINILTNKYIFRDAAVSWTFHGRDATGGTAYFADIQDISINKTEPINTVNLNYSIVRQTSARTDPGTNIKSSSFSISRETPRQLWRASGDVTLGLGVLAEDLTAGATGYIKMYTTAFTQGNWGQLSGYLLIDQEIIKYDSTEISYVDSSTREVIKTNIKNSDEFKSIQGQCLGNVSFTGNFNGISRGQFYTTPAAHLSPTSSWTGNVSGAITSQKYINPTSGVVNRYMQLNGSGAGNKTAFRNFGIDHSHWFCKLKISDTANINDRGGMVIWPQISGRNIKRGLWIEMKPVKKAEVSKYTEITVYVTNSSGGIDRNYTTKKFNANSAIFNAPVEMWANKGKALTSTGKTRSGWTRWFIYINTHNVGYFDLKNSDFSQKQTLGLFSKSKSVVRFDFAGGSSISGNTKISEGNYIQDIAKTISGILSYGKKITKSQISIDNFDASVRGIYYQKVHFESGPAKEVKIIAFANDGITTNANSGDQTQMAAKGDVAYAIAKKSPWYAEILLCNVSHRPVLLNVDSSSSYPILFGKIAERSDSQNVTKSDDNSVNRMGVKKFEGTLVWTSSRNAAEDLAQNILDVASNGTDYIEIKSFTNPLVSLCDIVEIDYPIKNLNTGDKFVVFSISTSWSNGPEYTIKAVRRQSV
jgi:hypothetical protein